MREQLQVARSQTNRLRYRAIFRRGSKWVAIVVCFFGVLGSVVVTSERLYRRAMRQRTTLKFVQIALALENYSNTVAQYEFERAHRPIPPTGLSARDVPWASGPLPLPTRRIPIAHGRVSSAQNDGGTFYNCSWRYTLVPYLAGVGDSVDFDEPWYAPVNRHQLTWFRYYSYAEPGDLYSLSEASAEEAIPDANALAITGPGTAFGDSEEAPMSLKEVAPNAILVVEVRASGVPWPAPGDLDFRRMPHRINWHGGKGISSAHRGGFHVIFGDRQVWFLSEKTPFERLKKFFTVRDAKQYDREQLLGPYALYRVP